MKVDIDNKKLEIIANIVGHIQGDGSISFRCPSKKSNRLYPWIRFNNSNLKLVKHVAQEIRMLFPNVRISIRERKTNKGNYVLDVTQSEVVNYFIKYGADIHKVPDWVLKGTITIKTSYLRALFDDDGCVYIGKTVSRGYSSLTKTIIIGISNEVFAKGIFSLLKNIGLKPYISKSKMERASRIFIQ